MWLPAVQTTLNPGPCLMRSTWMSLCSSTSLLPAAARSKLSGLLLLRSTSTFCSKSSSRKKCAGRVTNSCVCVCVVAEAAQNKQGEGHGLGLGEIQAGAAPATK